MGATVVLACRSFEATREALGRIRKESGNNDVHYMHLDLASLASVRTFAAEVRLLLLPSSLFSLSSTTLSLSSPSQVAAAYPSIHTLVCNAGVWSPMELHASTQDGLEVGHGCCSSCTTSTCTISTCHLHLPLLHLLSTG